MTERSLQVTYRKGKPFAAYLHLSHHTGEKNARTVPSSDGLLVVDYSANGQPMGVEITAPLAVPFERLNALLAELGEAPLPEQDYLPLRAAWGLERSRIMRPPARRLSSQPRSAATGWAGAHSGTRPAA